MSALVESLPGSSGKDIHTLFAIGDLFDTMNLGSAIANIVARLSTPANPTAPKPHIRASSKHFVYAVLVTNGMSNTDACIELKISPKTAEKWRRELRAVARDYYGWDVQYDCIASKIVHEELDRLQNRSSSVLKSRS